MWHWPHRRGRVSRIPAPAPRCRKRKHLRCQPRTLERITAEWFKSENIGGIPRYVAQVRASTATLAGTPRRIRLGPPPLPLTRFHQQWWLEQSTNDYIVRSRTKMHQSARPQHTFYSLIVSAHPVAPHAYPSLVIRWSRVTLTQHCSCAFIVDHPYSTTYWVFVS